MIVLRVWDRHPLIAGLGQLRTVRVVSTFGGVGRLAHTHKAGKGEVEDGKIISSRYAGLLRKHTASDSDDRLVVGLPAAFATGAGLDREVVLRGKDLGPICHTLRRQRLACRTIASYESSVSLQPPPLRSLV